MTIDTVQKPKNLTVGFEGVFLLHLEGEDQPWRRIGILLLLAGFLYVARHGCLREKNVQQDFRNVGPQT